MTTDMNGTTITRDATGEVIGDRAYFRFRIVDPEPDGHPGDVLAELTTMTGGRVTMESAVLVPARKLRLDVA